MNVLIHGPFGCGSLADEAMLAGLLARYAATKHGVTVLTADVDETKLLHGGVKAIKHDSPKTLLSNKPLWAAFDTSHLFVLVSAGPINFKGEMPARFWLNQFELVQKVGVKVGLVGIRAEPISEMRESVRAQRLLHHFSDSLTVRDDESKRVLADQGLNPNRVSVNGDPTLGLQPVPPKPEAKRVGLFLTHTLPSRTEFTYAPEATSATSEHGQRLRTLIDSLLKDNASLTIFHDAAAPVMEFVRDLIVGIDPDRLTLVAPDRSFGEILIEISRCEVSFSCTYHGALLSALCGVPSAAVSEEPCVPTLMKSLGLDAFLVSGAELGNAASILAKLTEQRSALSTDIQKRIGDMRKKEAQNIRALDALVPKREVYAKEKLRTREAEEAVEDPLEGPRRRRAPRKKHDRE